MEKVGTGEYTECEASQVVLGEECSIYVYSSATCRSQPLLCASDAVCTATTHVSLAAMNLDIWHLEYSSETISKEFARIPNQQERFCSAVPFRRFWDGSATCYFWFQYATWPGHLTCHQGESSCCKIHSGCGVQSRRGSCSKLIGGPLVGKSQGTLLSVGVGLLSPQ